MDPIGSTTVTGTLPKISDHGDREYVPVLIKFGDTKLEVLRDKPIVDQLNQNTSKDPVKVKVDYTDGEIHLSKAGYGGINMYIPNDMPDTIDTTNLKGNVGYGVFALVDNGKEILVIQKQKGKFWYLPGGLLEFPKDTTREEAMRRELGEETGAKISEKGTPIYLYESVIPPHKPRRHNLMEVQHIPLKRGFDLSNLTPIYSDVDLSNFTPNEEIADCMLIKPAVFWSSYLKNPKFSVPSMRYAISYWRDIKMNEAFESSIWNSESKRLYYSEKNLKCDELLFDLCFLEVEGSFTIGCDLYTLIDKTNERVRNYME